MGQPGTAELLVMERCGACGARLTNDSLIVCLDCGDGSEFAALHALKQTLTAARAWLTRAGPLLADMEKSDPRREKAAAQLRRRQAVYRALEELAKVSEETRLRVRYPFAVRWARQKGVLLVRDCLDGDWLEVSATTVPPWWKWVATEDAKKERAGRKVA